MTRTEVRRYILATIARLTDEVAAEPKPPKIPWQYLDVEQWEARQQHGPDYYPGLFPFDRRARTSRTILRMAASGLLDVTRGVYGRIEHIRITEAGRAALAELQEAGQ